MKLSTILMGAGVLAAGMGIPRARIVAVYDPAGDGASMDVLKDLARRAVNGETASPGKFITIVTEGNTLTPELSVKPGAVAYFWTDSTLETAPGFELLGECMLLESGLAVFDEGLAKQGPKEPAASAKTWVTGLQRASLERGGLRLGYSVSKPGPLSLEVFGVRGERLGSWNWREAAAGSFERSFALKGAAQGTFMIRWSSGNVQVVQKIHATSGGR